MAFSGYPTYFTVPAPLSTTTVTSGATTVVIKASAGLLGSVLVTGAGTGTASILFYDNSSTNTGTIIGATPASARAVGDSYSFNQSAANGIVVVQVTNGPTMTVSYF